MSDDTNTHSTKIADIIDAIPTKLKIAFQFLGNHTKRQHPTHLTVEAKWQVHDNSIVNPGRSVRIFFVSSHQVQRLQTLSLLANTTLYPRYTHTESDPNISDGASTVRRHPHPESSPSSGEEIMVRLLASVALPLHLFILLVTTRTADAFSINAADVASARSSANPQSDHRRCRNHQLRPLGSFWRHWIPETDFLTTVVVAGPDNDDTTAADGNGGGGGPTQRGSSEPRRQQQQQQHPSFSSPSRSLSSPWQPPAAAASTMLLAVTAALLLVVAAPPAGVAVSGGGLDYAGIDISGRDFSRSDYKGKDFTQVIAKGTSFAKSNLQGCRFYKAYLVSAASHHGDGE